MARHIVRRTGDLPVFCRLAGNRLHVVLCFVGQFALPREPVLNPARPGIVGGSRETEIAELPYEIAQEPRRRGDRLHRIERIIESDRCRGLRHELRDTLRTGAAHDVRLEPAFLKKKTDKKWDRYSLD